MMSSQNNDRQELNINILISLAIALVLTIIIYLLVLQISDTYLGKLLLERGFTQYVTIFNANLVATITVIKYIIITKEKRLFQKLGVPENIDFSNHKSIQISNLQSKFATNSTMVTNRLSRIFSAYMESGDRKTVTEFALDDSSFYISTSESSYAFPRILVWAIPLWGFIGTVVGISSAVNGFTGFLEQAAEIDQIKEGIGTVTSGLAVAFDTTLLALLLSVVVMIPLVLVEKIENELLLATDIYINDHILPRLKQQQNNLLNTEEIKRTIKQSIQKSLPTKEELIKPIKDSIPTTEELILPAQIYAKEAAQNLVKQFLMEFETIHKQEQELLNSLQKINQVVLQDRENFLATFGQQNQLNQSIITNVRELVELVTDNNIKNQENLERSTQSIVEQINKAATSLEDKVISLEKSSSKIAELNNFKSDFENIVNALQSVDKMQEELSNINHKITILEPILDKLTKPKTVKIVENYE